MLSSHEEECLSASSLSCGDCRRANERSQGIRREESGSTHMDGRIYACRGGRGRPLYVLYIPTGTGRVDREKDADRRWRAESNGSRDRRSTRATRVAVRDKDKDGSHARPDETPRPQRAVVCGRVSWPICADVRPCSCVKLTIIC